MIALDLLAADLRAVPGPRGIMLSGGLDSAAMLAMAVSLGETSWSVRVIPKADGAVQHAGRVLDWINHRWGLSLGLSPAGDPRLHHAAQLASAVAQAHAELPGVTWFSAENRVPVSLPNGPVRRRARVSWARQPWFDLTKDEITRSALQLGLHPLIALTHSCTERAEGRCGLCWQCGERAWAFGQLGVADPADC